MLMQRMTAVVVLGACGAFAFLAACGSSDTSEAAGCDPDSSTAGDDGNPSSGGEGGGPEGSGGEAPADGGEPAGMGGAGDGGAANTPAGATPIELTPSNLPELELAVEEDLIFNGETCADEARIDTDKGEITCYDPGMVGRRPTYVFQVVKQSDGSELAVFAGKNIVLEPTVRIVVEGQRPLVLLAPGNVQLGGTLHAIADHIYSDHGNAGGFGSQPGELVKGQGPGGGSGTSTSAGGGAYCGKGGKGGGVNGSLGGVAYGSEELIPLLGGSSGGNGGLGGTGGAGGGAVQIVAGGKLTLTRTGVIHVGGAGGGWNGGGAGSGGAILLEANEIEIAGTLAANGGGGGEATASGDNGLNATEDDVPARGGYTGTEATDDNGGDGSAGTVIDGSIGSTKSGGGGGGAGRIRLNSKSGEAKLSGVISPAVDSACVTQGLLDG